MAKVEHAAKNIFLRMADTKLYRCFKRDKTVTTPHAANLFGISTQHSGPREALLNAGYGRRPHSPSTVIGNIAEEKSNEDQQKYYWRELLNQYRNIFEFARGMLCRRVSTVTTLVATHKVQTKGLRSRAQGWSSLPRSAR